MANRETAAENGDSWLGLTSRHRPCRMMNTTSRHQAQRHTQSFQLLSCYSDLCWRANKLTRSDKLHTGGALFDIFDRCWLNDTFAKRQRTGNRWVDANSFRYRRGDQIRLFSIEIKYGNGIPHAQGEQINGRELRVMFKCNVWFWNRVSYSFKPWRKRKEMRRWANPRPAALTTDRWD